MEQYIININNLISNLNSKISDIEDELQDFKHKISEPDKNMKEYKIKIFYKSCNKAKELKEILLKII